MRYGMSCTYCALFLLVATVLLLFNSISLPYLPDTDLVRARVVAGEVWVANAQGTVTSSTISQLKFGLWGYCAIERPSGNLGCSNSEYASSAVVFDKRFNDSVTIKSDWTRGLAVHPVAAGLSFIALLLTFFSNTTAAVFATFLAAFVTLIAFAIDIAFFVLVKHQVGKLQHSDFITRPAPAFWITFISLLFLIMAGLFANEDVD